MWRIKRNDVVYELKNTFSSLVSRQHSWMNWVFLNYGYHNAHHYYPGAHWLDLPALDALLYPASEAHCFLLPQVLRTYHRHRITRITKGLGTPTYNPKTGRLSTEGYYGIIMNISFLTYDV